MLAPLKSSKIRSLQLNNLGSIILTCFLCTLTACVAGKSSHEDRQGTSISSNSQQTNVQGLPTSTATAIASNGGNEVFYRYKESFDNWPDGGCAETADQTPCNGTWISTFQDPPEQMGVSNYPECRSSKCVKSIYMDNEDGRMIVPMKRIPPGSREFYVRYYVKFAGDFAGGFPQALKQIRLFMDDGREVDVIAEFGEHYVFQNVVGSLPDNTPCLVNIDLPSYVGKWLKIEAMMKLNQISSGEGLCELVITPEGEEGFGTKEQGLFSKLGVKFSELTFIQSNWSQGIGSSPAPHRTTFIDDLCISGSISDRYDYCKD